MDDNVPVEPDLYVPENVNVSELYRHNISTDSYTLVQGDIGKWQSRKIRRKEVVV